MAVSLKRRQRDRIPLLLGQRRDVAERISGMQAHVDLPGRVGQLSNRHRLDRLAWIPTLIADHVDRCVVHDPVEPRPRLPYLSAAGQRQPRLRQRLLQDILHAMLLHADAPAIDIQRTTVTSHQDLEGPLVACPRQLGQTGVGLGGERADREARAHMLGLTASIPAGIAESEGRRVRIRRPRIHSTPKSRESFIGSTSFVSVSRSSAGVAIGPGRPIAGACREKGAGMEPTPSVAASSCWSTVSRRARSSPRRSLCSSRRDRPRRPWRRASARRHRRCLLLRCRRRARRRRGSG